MKTKLLVSFGVALALSITSIGCKQGEETPTDEPSQGDGGGGGGGTPTPTPTPTACNNPGSGFQPSNNGAYILNATGSQISSITIYFMAHTASVSYDFTVEAQQCGFGGTLLGSKQVTGMTSALAYQYTSKTITFDTAVPLTTCAGGNQTIAFKFTKNHAGTVYMGAQHAAGSACEIGVSATSHTTPPTAQGVYSYAGSYAN